MVERGPARRDRGGAEVELVILTPLLVLVIGLIVSLARLGLVKARVEDAAGAATTAAAQAMDPAAATAAAWAAVDADLGAGGVSCVRTSVSVDLARFQPGGRVTARVSCRVGLSSAAVPGLPGSVVVSGSSTGPVDPHRDPT